MHHVLLLSAGENSNSKTKKTVVENGSLSPCSLFPFFPCLSAFALLV